MIERIRQFLIPVIGVTMCLYTLVVVNFSVLQPESQKALFVLFGMTLCFLVFPAHKRFEKSTIARAIDLVLAAACVFCFGYIFVQSEPIPWFEATWWDGLSLSNRAGAEPRMDLVVGFIGLLLVLEATRRSIGWIVPAMALTFVFHSYYCYRSAMGDWPMMPDWMFPHAGQPVTEIISVTFLQSLGVLGPAADVMFRYVFLFVVFGAFLEMSGATQFIIDFAERVFGNSPGGPAKVSVLGSGLMGSLSGSAVANAVTTGSFTIPMMRNTGFGPAVAGGITAAAAAGGALVPPVMGAGAYMMLEFAKRGDTPVDFLEIVRAAIIPAVLYYFSLFMIVHFYSKRVGAKAAAEKQEESTGEKPPIWRFEGFVFFGALGVLVFLLAVGFSPFKSVTGALVLILVLTTLRPKSVIPASSQRIALGVFLLGTTVHQFLAREWIEPSLLNAGENLRWLANYVIPFLAESWRHPDTGNVEVWLVVTSLIGSSIVGALGMLIYGLIDSKWRPEVRKAFARSARNGVSLVAASACVGIIIGIVQSTPVANEFSEAIKGIVESNLLLALIGIMVCSIILGMGVPSVVCYLLMATLMGSLLGEMGVDPLAAHLFIFYFGMMSMVTPPVALAAYASASIAEAEVMPTAMAAFRFSLVGFTLPFMFVYRPELLLMLPTGEMIGWVDLPRTLLVTAAALAGVVALSGAVSGQFFKGRLHWWERALLTVAAIMLLMPAAQIGERDYGWVVNIVGAVVLVAAAILNRVTVDAAAPPAVAD